ncbi:gamma-glutamylcyclotransferase [Aeoliella sp. ICT_H6.2]|uniref:Putative gamma-glutamylcyclotransferase n=1 Tax=Aeoliella straminimaris TaxID=2954799 RepID=A0A9X2FI87_9BACT|nr:gamma-glutamylcyclotransferase family protein [Aeoliella straminimaris]MCO6046881.1 gamma-glutamylcyclotransferase [Aeoliella straminimaris]
MSHVFVYGTLIAPEMISAVTGQLFHGTTAVAPGFKRAYLTERVYPGIVVDPASEVEGLVYLDVDEESLRRLDYFEGPEYVRGTLAVRLEDGRQVQAQAYIIPAANGHLMTERPWSVEYFVAQDLSGFVERARLCMENYEPGKAPNRVP